MLVDMTAENTLWNMEERFWPKDEAASRHWCIWLKTVVHTPAETA